MDDSTEYMTFLTVFVYEMEILILDKKFESIWGMHS
jgi:hypothetical protein